MDTMDLEGINLAEICRTCKCVSPHMLSIFEEYENSYQSHNSLSILCQSPRIDEMLMACASVQVMCGDGFPSLICQVCVEQLRGAFVFKRQCEKVDESLREYAKTVKVIEIKEELQNSDFMESSNTLNSLLNEEQSSFKEDAWDGTPALVAPNVKRDYIQFMDNNQILLTCCECAKIFTTLEALRCHKHIHTGGMSKCNKRSDKECTRQNHLHRHAQTYSRRKVHICRICSKALTRDNLKRHLVTHLREKPYSCKRCNRGFNRMDNLYKHVPRCKGDTVYPCYICNRSFNREDKLELHKKKHDSLALPTIENLDNIDDYYYQIGQDTNVISDHSNVDDCSEPQAEITEGMDEQKIKEEADISNLDEESNVTENSAAANENLEVEEVKVKDEVISEPVKDDDDNIDIVNEVVDQDFGGNSTEYLSMTFVSAKVKRECDRPCKNPNAQPELPKAKVPGGNHSIKNIKKEKDEEYGEFPCPSCQVMFNTISQLDRHARQMHKGLKIHKCSVCNKEFNRVNHLNQHQKVHERQNNFKCDICEKIFLSKSHFNQHMRSHNEHSKKHLCTECGQRFLKKDNLIVHMRRHRGEKPFKCKYCGKGFPRSTDMMVHERYHTGEKTHLCTICGKSFRRGYDMNIHMRTHTGHKPYQCTDCEAAFAQMGDFKAHMRRHTGERLRCELCTKSFLKGCTLKRHKRTVHGLNIISNITRLQRFHKQENPDKPPPITEPLSKPVAPENIVLNANAPSGEGIV